MALCLVIQFRLWDDLADVESDRLTYPERVLCQTHSYRMFWGTLGLLLIVNAVLIASFKSTHSVGVFLVLNASCLIWYSLLRKLLSNRVVSHLIVLVKYPVFVFLLSGSQTDARVGLSLGYGMFVTFFCFCAYELQHDQRLRAERHATSLLACHLFGMWFVAIFMLIELRTHASNLALVQAGLLGLGSIVLVYLLQRHRARADPGRWCFVVFFVAFAWLLNFALGSCGQFAPPTILLTTVVSPID